jgi:hypothetical protein
MTEWWAFKPITTAFEKTKKILLEPFNVWTWIKLCVIVFFVGGAGRFGSQFSNVLNYRDISGEVAYRTAIDNLLSNRSLLMLIVALVILALLIVIILAYLRNVFSLVLIRALTTGDVHVIKPMRDNLGKGLRLFVFSLLLGLFTLAVVAILAVAMILCVVLAIKTGVSSAGAIILVALLGFIVVLLLALLAAFSIVMSVIIGFTYDFVAPMMLFKGMGVVEAWKYLYKLIRKEWKQFGVYVIVRWALELLIGIIIGIISIPIILIFIALLVVGLFMAIETAKVSALLVALIAIGILIGVLLFVAIMLVISMPVAVYLRYYSLDVLKNIDPAAVEYSEKIGTP